jgi:hypothetical protein
MQIFWYIVFDDFECFLFCSGRIDNPKPLQRCFFKSQIGLLFRDLRLLCKLVSFFVDFLLLNLNLYIVLKY